MDRDKKFYLRLYAKDFLMILSLTYVLEILAMFILEFVPFDYFDGHSVLLFLVLFPPVLSIILIAGEIFVYEHIEERLKAMNMRKLERR